MKVSWKHIAAYLPYGLEVLTDWSIVGHHNSSKSIGNWTEHGINKGDLYALREGACIIHGLRPLSDLTKEIEHNGEKFVPYDKLKTVVSEEQWIKICNTVNDDYSKICDMPNWWVEQLYSWKFDVFGLLEEGLAVNIDDIEQ